MNSEAGRSKTFEDEAYTKIFVACGVGALLRKCLICDKVFSREDSFKHSKFPCHHQRRPPIE